MKVFIKTLGCKVNQVESAYIYEILKKRGFELSFSEEEAEIFILNSCAVTESAVKESKKILRHWIQLKPKGIILAGCVAQVMSKELENFFKKQNFSSFLILGQNEKLEIERFLDLVVNQEVLEKTIYITSSWENCYPIFLEEFINRSRAFIKIQDGCSSYCSYCIVPFTRGPVRSLPEELILKQIRKFLEKGYQEIVLTGINLGKWGEDLTPPRNLFTLLYQIEVLKEEVSRPFQIRLSSLEVNEIDEAFLEYAKQSSLLCPHFHIPLQSGSNFILKKMNRKYSAEEYLEKLLLLKKLFPYATLGADVMVGFPGEGEKEFLETYELLKASPLNWLHIFPFSERPGTPAEKMTPKVSPQEKKQRLALLKNLAEKKRLSFLQENLKTLRKAIVEEFSEKSVKALTDNYISVILKKIYLEGLRKGRLIKVYLEKIKGNQMEGKFVEFF